MSEIEKLKEENNMLKNKIKDLTTMEERYKDFMKMNELMIQRLNDDNDKLRQKNIELEKEISFKNTAIEKEKKEKNHKKDMENFDKFMVSFKRTNA
jgi:dimeric dUTPase (all-alpha-NTP-PPase superfamily)